MREWFICSAAWFGTVGQWFAGIGTILAVLVALFKDRYDRWRRRPILKVTARPHSPDCTKALILGFDRAGAVTARADCYYVRLWVENVGKDGAHQVQVYAARLWKRSADGAFNAVEAFLPMNLLWAHSRPGKPDVFAEGISAQMGRHCDLAHVIEPVQSEAFGAKHEDAVLGQCSLILDLEAPPATGEHLLSAGTYRLELWVAAANARRVTYTAEVTLDGRWFDEPREMFAQGLSARLD